MQKVGNRQKNPKFCCLSLLFCRCVFRQSSIHIWNKYIWNTGGISTYLCTYFGICVHAYLCMYFNTYIRPYLYISVTKCLLVSARIQVYLHISYSVSAHILVCICVYPVFLSSGHLCVLLWTIFYQLAAVLQLLLKSRHNPAALSTLLHHSDSDCIKGADTAWQPYSH